MVRDSVKAGSKINMIELALHAYIGFLAKFVAFIK